MTYAIALEQVKRHLGPAYVAVIDGHALSYAYQTALAITQRDNYRTSLNDAMLELMNANSNARTRLEVCASIARAFPNV